MRSTDIDTGLSTRISLSTHIHLSDEQAMLLEAASNFCRERSPSLTVRGLMGSETGYDAAVWRDIVAMGDRKSVV